MIYTTVQGDTFDRIAKVHLKSEFRIDQLIAANWHLCGVLVFEAGVRINIPELPEDTPANGSMPPWRRAN